MAKVKVNTRKAEKALKKRFDAATTNKSLLNDIGETEVKNAKAEVRLGKDPDTLKTFEGFENPKDYGARRSQIAKNAGRGRSFKPKKANMTLSGQLLEAYRYVIKRGKVILDIEDTSRKPYGNESKVPTNKELARFHKEGAGSYPKRNILGVSEKTSETIANKVRAFLRRNINR